jgi:hypothetical protein
MVEMTGSRGTLEITTLHGDLVLQCPVARGTIVFPARPDKYRVKVIENRVDLFVREVNVPAGIRSSVVVNAGDEP